MEELWIPRNTKLLVTSRLHFELDAASEVWHALRVTGICEDAGVHLVKKGREWIRGLIAFYFDGDPIKAISAVREYFKLKPWIMEFTEKIYPIMFVTNDLDEAAEYVEKKAQQVIRPENTWRIKVFKHNAKLKRKKVIDALAQKVDIGKVKMEEPDWYITVHIIKTTLALAVIKKEQIVQKKDIKVPRTWKDLTFI